MRYLPYSHLEGECREHIASHTLAFSQKVAEFGEAERAAEIVSFSQVKTYLVVHMSCLTASCGQVFDRLEPGDAVVHHCQTIHRAEPNLADASSRRQRRALGVVYRGESVRVDAAAVSDHVQSIVDQGLPGGGAMREGCQAAGGAKRRARL